MSRYRTAAAARRDGYQEKLERGPNGRYLCRFCKIEVTPPRRTFCSGAKTEYRRRKINGVWTKIVYRQGSGCVHEWCLRNQPRYAREAVFDREQGICAMCGSQHSRKGEWQADHIIPVALGGGQCGLENLQLLCTPCHKIKTASDIQKIKKEKSSPT